MAWTLAGLYSDAFNWSSTGKPAPALPVTVRVRAGSTPQITDPLATLYTDQTAGTTAANPALTDSNGNLAFYTLPKRVDLWANGQYVTTVEIEPDINDPAFGGASLSPATTVTGPDALGATAAVGTSTLYARQDHDHGLGAAPVFAAGAMLFGTHAARPAAAAGNANCYYFETDTVLLFQNQSGVTWAQITPVPTPGTPATTVTGPDAFGAASVVGTSTNYARQDHDHGLPVSPGVLTPTTVKTTAYTAAAGDFVPVDTTGGAVTIALPSAPADKTRIGVKMVTQGATNTVTVARGGTDVFNKTGGVTSLTLALLNQDVVVQYTSATGVWYVQSDDFPLSGLDLRYAVVSSPRLVTAAYTVALADTSIVADATGQPPPTAITATPVASCGTFAARSAPQGYFWAVTAVGPSGESVALPAGAAQPIVANGSATLSWTAAPGATSYKVYRATFATNVYPPQGTLGLVASGIVGTTYTDTGTATSAGTPPASNGGAFTITLPDATQYKGALSLRAIGNTPNVVLVQSVSGQQIGTYGTSISLGQTYGATFNGVELVSDGTNWRVVSSTPVPLWSGVAMGLNAGTITPAMGLTPVAIVGVPVLGFGQRLKAHVSFQALPATSATQLLGGIYFCTSGGAFQGYNTGLAGTLNGSQMAFWYIQNFSPGEYATFAMDWGYLPRAGDYNAEGGGFGGYGTNLGLFVQTTGGNCQVSSSSIDVDGGALNASYYGSS